MIHTYNDENHAEGRFPSDEPGTASQDYDGHGDGDDGEVELGIVFGGRDHHQELHGEPKEEEEIELQKGDVDLVSRGQNEIKGRRGDPKTLT